MSNSTNSILLDVGAIVSDLHYDHSKKVPVGTIKGISNYFTFMWPSGDKDGYIAAYEIPNYGKSKKIFNF
ncbi:2739_t:CDS:2 [Entrophospora sp. SA101]|nr:2739_t:CDS:2 [Entrophospora sp. SA101]